MKARFQLLAICTTIFVDMLGYGLIIPLLPLYVTGLGGGATLAGSLAAVYALVQALSGPLLSALADQRGRKPVLLLCLLGTGFAFLMLGFADALWLLGMALLLDAITGGNASVAQTYIVDISDDSSRARNFGFAGVAFGLGVTSGPLLAGLLSGYGLQAAAFVAAGLAFTNALFVVFVLSESLENRQTALASKGALPNPVRAILAVARVPGMRRLLLALMAINFSFAVLQSIFALFSRARFGWQLPDQALFFAFVGVCSVFTQGVLLQPLIKRWGERTLACNSPVLMMLGLALMAAASQAWMLYPAAALAALGSNLAIPTLSSLIGRRASPDTRGATMGALQLAINIALVSGPLIGGLSFDQIDMRAPLILGACTALLAGVLLGMVDDEF